MNLRHAIWCIDVSAFPPIPQKHHAHLFNKPLSSLNLQTIQVPPFLGNPPYILVFRDSPTPPL